MTYSSWPQSISKLTGTPIEQTKWNAKLDPRLTFMLTRQATHYEITVHTGTPECPEILELISEVETVAEGLHGIIAKDNIEKLARVENVKKIVLGWPKIMG